MRLTSPSFPNGAQCDRTEVEARREKLEADLRAEGCSETIIRRLATYDSAVKMVDYERGLLDFIMFGLRI